MLKPIIENAKFLVLEAEGQVKLTFGLLSNFDNSLLEKIASKDDYIDNLKTTVENMCFSKIHGYKYVSEKEINAIRALHVICVNLERIGDFCVNIARQTMYLSDIAFIRTYDDYQKMFSEVSAALLKIIPVFEDRNLTGALEICRVEYHLDMLYKKNFDRIMIALRQGKDVANLITVLFIFRYLERIGDSLLNIGEALIFAAIGDRIKIRQFDALQQTLSESGFRGKLSDIDFSSIWGSRSGCRIGKVDNRTPSEISANGIFKEGSLKKIRKEKENIERWNTIYPGLVPRIFGYHEKQNTASMLVEFLSGCTLDQVVLTDDAEIFKNSLFILENILADIWEGTKQDQQTATDYMKQLTARLEDVRRVHPDFYRHDKQIGDLHILSSQELIRQCADIEAQTPAPFTIFIHGDFNVNNIVYDHPNQKIHYIDLYRSKHADYIQDASVFLISNFRMPIFNTALRERLNTVIEHFFSFFSFFAQKYTDKTFDIRMALALARSFYTSCRFELNRRFAKEMFLRSHFLMEQIVSHRDSQKEFVLPSEILYY